MKNYIIYLISILAVSLLLSCDRGGEPELKNNTLRLTLACTDITRATEDGDDALNENKLTSIDCFFYPAGADFNTPARAKRSFTSLSASGVYSTYISFEENEITTIFGDLTGKSSASCLIYVIANRPDGVTLPDGNPTINQLKRLTIESDFQSYKTPQPSFVMDSKGNDVVSLVVNSNGSKSLSATVPLYRTAAKISFSISGFGGTGSGGSVVVNGQTYTPDYSGIYVILDNAVKKSHIGPDVILNSDIENPYCDVGGEEEAKKIKMVATDGHAPCTLTMPFYSYPSDWSVNEENDTYISLVVPWKTTISNGDGTTTTTITPYHYKVPINYDGDKIERNTHYKISVQISVLGTLDPDLAVEIDPSYVIFDCLTWKNDEIETTMTDFRYLMVEENSYVMNNVDEIMIPYWSSHPCELTNISIKRLNLKSGNYDNITSDYTLVLRDGHIRYYRELHNSFSHDEFDFAPYTITFTIQHTTESTRYNETITIKQYPAVYGDYDNNTDYDNDGSSNSNKDKGFAFVNGYQGTESSAANKGQDYFGLINGTSSSTGVSAISMFVFSVSSVEGTNYVIGDPREEEVNSSFINEKHGNNNSNSIWVEAPAVGSSTSRGLQNYYATYVYNSGYDNRNANSSNIYANNSAAAAAERTYNMIAPKFRIASGYCVMSSFSDENNYYHYMKKRCASYQEDGYPAGRWRLPTKAELEFIVDLSNKDKIPTLFNSTIKYWCAHGYVQVSGGNVNITHAAYVNGGASARCVYDDWYWGSDPVLKTEAEKRVFTWGDVNRANKADAPAINY